MGGKYCLTKDEFTYGVCCDPTLSESQMSQTCKNQMNNELCADNTFTDQNLRNFVCPASQWHCPSEHGEIKLEITERKKEFFREFTWN